MKIKPEELPAAGYELKYELDHAAIVPFIRAQLKKRTTYSRLFVLFNLIALGLVGYYFVSGYRSENYHLEIQITRLSYGLALAFALIPLHEYIHVVAYKWQGATNTSYRVNLKKFYFMALADGFVASKREFEVVALAPFTTVSVAATMLLLLGNPSWSLTVCSTLLAHTSMCSGDFGLLSYMELHKDNQPVTFDDVGKETSYFCIKVQKDQTP